LKLALNKILKGEFMIENTFKNLKQVAIYLREIGYKISKTQIYEHGKTRKIKPRDDGKYYLLDVEQYAKDYLKSEKLSLKHFNKTQRRRNEAEAAKLEAQAKHWQIKTKIMEGSFVPRESFEQALALRALLFKNDLQYLAHAQAPEICRLVKGDNNLIPELMEYLSGQFDIFLNHYAENKEFEIIIPAAQEDDLDNDDKENNAEFFENAPASDN
jgi:hypothetical protein